MKKRSRVALFSMIIAVFLTVFSGQIFALEQQPESQSNAEVLSEFEKNRLFREENGFNANKDFITAAMKNEKVGRYFVSLTPSEEGEMDARKKLQSQVPDIRKYINDNIGLPIDDLYFDNKNGGTLNLGFKDLDKVNTVAIKEFSSDPNRIRFYTTKYSSVEMDELVAKINKFSRNIYDQGVTIVSVSPSPISQKVEIVVLDSYSLNNLNSTLNKYFSFDSDMISVSIGEMAKPILLDRAASRWRAVPGGAQVGFSGSGFCTVGFTAKDDSQYYYISAGHCMGYAGQSVNQSYTLPNLVAYANRESLYWGTTADASASTIDPSNATSWIMNATSAGLISSQNNLIAAEQINEFVGLGVCMSLGQTNNNICTSVSSLNTSGFWGGTYVTNQRKVLYTAQAGDSGSPVYATCFECGNNAAIYGIAVSVDSNGTLVSYVGNIKTELGVIVEKNNNNTITFTP
jgi:hypothetical protein